MEDIRNWLNGDRDYATGVKLFVDYGKDPALARLFTQEGFSEYKFKRLVDALKDLIKKPDVVPGIRIRQQPKQEITDDKPQAPALKWSKERDAVEQSLYIQWKEKYAEMMNLSARIGEFSKQATKAGDNSKIDEAGRMAIRILDLDDQCDHLFAQRNFYVDNKELPADEGPIKIALDSNLWYKKLHNHQRYIRKFRMKIDKDPGDTAAATLLKNHEWAEREYKKLLKMD